MEHKYVLFGRRKQIFTTSTFPSKIFIYYLQNAIQMERDKKVSQQTGRLLFKKEVIDRDWSLSIIPY
jgi:hypothetical protein